jgi:hypothetical protein
LAIDAPIGEQCLISYLPEALSSPGYPYGYSTVNVASITRFLLVLKGGEETRRF